jgi:hypothetical protein
MLEFALKQERLKFHRLKYGCDPPLNDLKPPNDEPGIGNEVAPGIIIAVDLFTKVRLPIFFPNFRPRSTVQFGVKHNLATRQTIVAPVSTGDWLHRNNHRHSFKSGAFNIRTK